MSNHERELREALEARAGAVPVGRADEPGLVRRLAAARRRRRQARLAGLAAVLVLALSAVSLASAEGPDRDTVIAGPDTSSTTTAAVASTTTVDTAPAETTVTLPAPLPTTVAPEISASPTTVAADVPRTTTTTVAPLPPVPDDAVWPPPGSTTTFSTPERATNDFARRFLGMGNPQLSPGRVSVGGNDATVDIRPLPGGGPTTTVLLRRVGGRGWVVVGSSAERILVSEPAVGGTVSSPLTVRGEAWTFEGNVIVEVRRDGVNAPLGESFGTGGGDQMLPFEATVSFARPSVARGTVVALEPRVDDGDQGPAAATVIRIRF